MPENAPFDNVTVRGVTDIVPEPVPLVKTPARTQAPEAKSATPTVGEWQDFFARFVVRGITSGYLALVLRDVEDELTDREREKIQLSQEDLADIAAPLASFSSKNKFMRKHGRSIVSAADSSEAIIALAMWMRRVNKLAKKYRKNKVTGQVIERQDNGNSGPNDEQGQVYYPGPLFNPGSGS